MDPEGEWFSRFVSDPVEKGCIFLKEKLLVVFLRNKNKKQGAGSVVHLVNPLPVAMASHMGAGF